MTTGLSDIAERVWPVLLFLALIQVVADLCDEAGLFDVSAHVASRLARGSRLGLFLLFVLLATVATWLLSIDTTAVLLTPIGLALASELGISALPFAFASVWLANSASLLLPVSNLTNLLAQERLDLSATAFMGATWAPQLAVLVVVLFSLVDVIVDHAHRALHSLFGTGESLAALAQLALSTSVLANVLNNLPAYLVAEPFAGTTSRLVTVLVGVNVGPMVLVWGSLANLLWLRACRTRGLQVSAVRFGLEGLLVVPLAVAAGVLAVWLT